MLASGQTKQEGRHRKLRDIGWDWVNREYQLLSRHITIIDCTAQPRVITVTFDEENSSVQNETDDVTMAESG